jgi:hypothetical protein
MDRAASLRSPPPIAEKKTWVRNPSASQRPNPDLYPQRVGQITHQPRQDANAAEKPKQINR